MSVSARWKGAQVFVNKLRDLCIQLGGELILLPEASFARLFRPWEHGNTQDNYPFTEAPQSNRGHGVNYDKLTVYAQRDLVQPNALIHEMAHVFASPKPPDWADEYSFLGWEICCAIKFGLYQAWSRDNKDYGINAGRTEGFPREFSEWQDINAHGRALVCRNRIEAAQADGLVDGNFNPLSIR